MNNQLDIFEVHAKENNSESEQHLKESKSRFSAQCDLVLHTMLSGQKMSCISAANELFIMDLRRRVKDLKDAGVQITYEWVEFGKSKIKHYFMNEEQRTYNKRFCLPELKQL